MNFCCEGGNGGKTRVCCLIRTSLYLCVCVCCIVCHVGGVSFHHAIFFFFLPFLGHTFLAQDPPFLRILSCVRSWFTFKLCFAVIVWGFFSFLKRHDFFFFLIYIINYTKMSLLYKGMAWNLFIWLALEWITVLCLDLWVWDYPEDYMSTGKQD